MKKYFKKIVLCGVIVLFFGAAKADDCSEATQGTIGVLRDYTETVTQCLNLQDQGLASVFEKILDRYVVVCMDRCADNERAHLCIKAREAKNNLKAAYPSECTN